MKAIKASLIWFAGSAAAQSRSSQSQSVVTLTGSARSLTNGGEFGPIPTVPPNFQSSGFASLTLSSSLNGTRLANSTVSQSTSTPDNRVTVIEGGSKTQTPTPTATSPDRPLNTQPCNNYPEFCNRKYSNITEVCTHNSPFTRPNNVARNQDYGVTQQLNDGIRTLQGQAHLVNGTLYFCHTSCDLLNAGTVEDYLREVTAWLAKHPFDVITIIFGNYDWQKKDENGNALVTSVDYVDPITKSGLLKYIYQPPKSVMTLQDWPTLGEMILRNKRVVTFIDYNFDTGKVPYMLWQSYNVWQTPFSPTNFNDPCTLGGPAGLDETEMRNMMYLANHNLNTEIAIAGLSILVPNVVDINRTNGVEGEGSLGLRTQQCTGIWGRPPNFLVVDFYNQGSTSGSVFEVAARANGVTYNRECCGKAMSFATGVLMPSAVYLCLSIVVAMALTL